MKHLLLFAIRIYWKTFPEHRRRKCIFKKSCSNYVFDITKQKGFLKGLQSLFYRYKNCRGGFQIFINPINGQKLIILPSREVIDEKEIAEGILNKSY